MTDQTQTLEPAMTRAGEGEARWWLGCLAEVKLGAEQTGGALTIVEITEPAGPGDIFAPLHVHLHDDETFWMLEGGATFRVGEDEFHASAGDVVFGPRGVPHTYAPDAGGCRLLFIMTPGGFEKLVREMSVPAQTRTLPPPSDEEPDWAHVAAVAEANGCRLLG